MSIPTLVPVYQQAYNPMSEDTNPILITQAHSA
jgi:hypothetical protein